MSTESIDPRFADYQRPDSLQKRLEAIDSVEGEVRQQGSPVAIVVGQWHNYIVDRLLEGALDTLNESGITDTEVKLVHAPGAYEFPLVVKALAEQNRYAAVVTLGVVIKGETPHFDYVAGECARGLADVSRQYNLPVGFGVLTVNTVDQAIARAQPGESNKGREAVLAAMQVADLLGKLK